MYRRGNYDGYCFIKAFLTVDRIPNRLLYKIQWKNSGWQRLLHVCYENARFNPSCNPIFGSTVEIISRHKELTAVLTIL